MSLPHASISRGQHPNPLLVTLLLHEARHFVRFYLKALNHHIWMRGNCSDLINYSAQLDYIELFHIPSDLVVTF
jgi:hypothetical protein